MVVNDGRNQVGPPDPPEPDLRRGLYLRPQSHPQTDLRSIPRNPAAGLDLVIRVRADNASTRRHDRHGRWPTRVKLLVPARSCANQIGLKEKDSMEKKELRLAVEELEQRIAPDTI